MSKSLIYTVNNAGAVVPIGGNVPVGSIIRRYGKCIDATGSAINLFEPGYYDVDISVTITAAVAGDVIFTLAQDGVPVTGATATASIATPTTQFENVAIMATIRVKCCGNANLAVLVGGTTAPTVRNMAIQVTKVI